MELKSTTLDDPTRTPQRLLRGVDVKTFANCFFERRSDAQLFLGYNANRFYSATSDEASQDPVDAARSLAIRFIFNHMQSSTDERSFESVYELIKSFEPNFTPIELTTMIGRDPVGVTRLLNGSKTKGVSNSFLNLIYNLLINANLTKRREILAALRKNVEDEAIARHADLKKLKQTGRWSSCSTHPDVIEHHKKKKEKAKQAKLATPSNQ